MPVALCESPGWNPVMDSSTRSSGKSDLASARSPNLEQDESVVAQTESSTVTANSKHPMRRAYRSALRACAAALFTAVGTSEAATDWREASREPVGLAPDPALVKDAVVQVYGARTVGAKGLFGVHTWVAVKPTDAPASRAARTAPPPPERDSASPFVKIDPTTLQRRDK